MQPSVFLANGLLLGLATGPACLVSCVPVLVPVLLHNGQPNLQPAFSWPPLLRFLAGRLISTTIIALLTGLIGPFISEEASSFFRGITLVLALLLLAHGLGISLPRPCLKEYVQRFHHHLPLMLGLLTGLMPCPPFLMAITWCCQQQTPPLLAFSFFMLFLIGTSLYLLPVGFCGFIPQNRFRSQLARISSLLAGMVFLLQGITSD